MYPPLYLVIGMVSLVRFTAAVPNWVEKQFHERATQWIGRIDAEVPNALKNGKYCGHKISIDALEDLKDLSTDYSDFEENFMDNISDKMRQRMHADKVNVLFKNTRDIQVLWNESFFDIFVNLCKYPRHELQELTNNTNCQIVRELRTKILDSYDIFFNRDITKDSILHVLNDVSPSGIVCIRNRSAQHLMIDFYKMIVLSHMKGMMLIYFFYTVKESLIKEDYSYLKNKEFSDYKRKIEMAYTKLSKFLSSTTSREFWKCDPKRHEKDATYSDLDQVFRAYIVNEYDLAGYHWTNDHSCDLLTDERLRCRTDDCKNVPEKKRCRGHLRDCSYFYSYDTKVCYSYPDSNRTYNWVIKTIGDAVYVLGNTNVSCFRKRKLTYSNFSPCLCKCESEDRNIARYFSLEDTIAEVDDNRVIIGARLVNKDNVFHIQIKQATLGANATIIDRGNWKKIDDNMPPDYLTSEHVSTYHYVNKNENGENDPLNYDEWTEFYKNDYVYAVTHEQNIIFLDEMETRPNTVLTGLRFRQADNALRFEIRETQFDYDTGKLNVNESYWQWSIETVKTRSEVILENPEDPLKTPSHQLVSKNEQFIKFKFSDMTTDVGQSTVPFLDLQDVELDPPMPLTGAGFFHKKSPTSGGFLSLKLQHYDFSKLR